MEPQSITEDPVMVEFQPQKTSIWSMKFIVILLITILLGTGTGYMLSQTSGADGVLPTVGGGSSVAKGKTYGSDDTKTFNDEAEGTVREGGIEGEGQFHLVRPGGESQNVYMTSSNVDLSEFVGKKVKVWGQTQKAQRAGWLMDVGRVQVL